ncbi:MAG TPA: MerR family transcriptional regulator [Acidimicrobiales bacterium]|jgi:DNA-binding transcriptional MerR regulator
MGVRLTIGEFSRMTHLSVKALRHYHDVGLLAPADIDPASGYRFYDPTQVPTAQAIRRFRDLDMPIEQVRAVLEAPDLAARNQAIMVHLQHMEDRLEQTQTTVASLRLLLEHQVAEPISVEYRLVEAEPTLSISERIGMDDTDDWLAAAFPELYERVAAAGLEPAGPSGALYSGEFFEAGAGDVRAFVPVAGDISQTGRARPFAIPASRLAVTVHHGLFADIDRTYGALGTYVAERGLGVPGPIRENYLVTEDDSDDPQALETEVCWPITTPAAQPPG